MWQLLQVILVLFTFSTALSLFSNFLEFELQQIWALHQYYPTSTLFQTNWLQELKKHKKKNVDMLHDEASISSETDKLGDKLGDNSSDTC